MDLFYELILLSSYYNNQVSNGVRFIILY